MEDHLHLLSLAFPNAADFKGLQEVTQVS